MGEVVGDADADRAVVHRVRRGEVERRRLQEAGRQDHLVELDVDVRIGRRRGQLPDLAARALPDAPAVGVDPNRRPAATFAQNASRRMTSAE